MAPSSTEGQSLFALRLDVHQVTPFQKKIQLNLKPITYHPLQRRRLTLRDDDHERDCATG